jgi:hypothetical protein
MALGLPDRVEPHGSRGGRDADWVPPKEMAVAEC